MGEFLSIDETALSNDELYTVVTNKAAKGRKGTVVAMIRGTQSDKLIDVLNKIPERLRKQVREVTLDMAANMNLVVKRCFHMPIASSTASMSSNWPLKPYRNCA